MASSGIETSGPRPGAKVGEKAVYLHPDLGSPGESFPLTSEDADKFVTFVDRSDIVLRGNPLLTPIDAINEQGLDIGLETPQHRILLNERIPRVQGQQG